MHPTGAMFDSDKRKDHMNRTNEAATAHTALARNSIMNTPLETNEPDDKWRILIIDDNRQFGRSAHSILQNARKYAVCDINDPRRALETARGFKPDLVLVDLFMPQEDGSEVAAELEADRALHDVPIVFMTALITREEASDGRRVNGHRLIAKPRSSADLLRMVEENLPCCTEA